MESPITNYRPFSLHLVEQVGREMESQITNRSPSVFISTYRKAGKWKIVNINYRLFSLYPNAQVGREMEKS